MGLIEKLDESKKFIGSKTGVKPEVALILGSGLSSISDGVSDAVRIPFGEIPHFAKSTVEGHKGELVIGSLSGRNVMIMAGRIHFYEGHTMKDITYPERLMKHLGAEKLIITAAVGAVNKKFKPGDIMLIIDHINFMGRTLLWGPKAHCSGPVFPICRRYIIMN